MNLPSLGHTLPPEGLDARIRRVEQRLIEREQAFRRGCDALGRQLRDTLQPGRLLGSLLGGALAASAAGLLVWRLRRHHVGLAAGAAAAGTQPAPHKGGSSSWVRLVALAWPMLPTAWRARISPASASMLAGVGLPLVEALLRGPRISPPATMPSVDLARFTGRWHVAARWPQAKARRRAAAEMHYLPRDDGRLDVIWCDDVGAPLAGVAQVVPGSGGAKLRLSFAPRWLRVLPWAWHEQWLLHIEPAYDAALVGSPRRDRLLLLSRAPALAPAQRHALLLQARERGFAVERLGVAHLHARPHPRTAA